MSSAKWHDRAIRPKPFHRRIIRVTEQSQHRIPNVVLNKFIWVRKGLRRGKGGNTSASTEPKHNLIEWRHKRHEPEKTQKTSGKQGTLPDGAGELQVIV